MKAMRSQDLQFASCRPRKTGNVVLVQSPVGSKSKKSDISIQFQRQEKTDIMAQTGREEFPVTHRKVGP
jgi:hypothetical protein